MADGTYDGNTFIAPEANKLKVFISYSRNDLDFADQLAAALQTCGFSPTIDRHGISGGEAWQQRLGALILEADTVVFVLSPSSARSEVCAWEVEEAMRVGKRILPVLACPLEAADPPPRLRDLNYMFFYREPKSPGSGFGVGLTDLVAALNTDLGWIREHTRLLERATEWQTGRRSTGRLLSGTDITQAKAWAARRPKGAPEPTPLHLEFIRASEQEEAGRASAERKRLEEMAAAQGERAKALQAAEEAVQNTATALRARDRTRTIMTWSSIAFAVAIGALAVIAGLKWHSANVGFATAQKAQQEAEQNLYEAQVTRSRTLIKQAKQYMDQSDHSTGLLLTLEALLGPKETIKQRYFYIPDAENTLIEGLSELRELGVLGRRPGVNGIAISQDGAFIVTSSDDQSGRILDTKTRKELLQLKGPIGPISAVALTSDGARIVTSSMNEEIARIWDAHTGAQLLELKGHSSSIHSLAITADGTRIVTGAGGNSPARVWDAMTGAEVLQLKGHTLGVNSVWVTPDGNQIVTGSDDRTVRLWDAKTGTELLQLTGHVAPIYGVALTPDGTRIVSGSGDHTVRVWDARSGEMALQLKGHSGAVYAVAATPDGARFVTASDDKSVRIWDAATGDLQLQLKGHSGAVRGVAISPDGTRIITASHDNTARIWSARPTVQAAILKDRHSQPLQTIAVTPDGTRIVTGSADTTARMWDMRTGVEMLVLKGHGGGVNGVAVMPDGARIATGSSDKTARVWDAKTGSEILTLKGHVGPIYGIAYTSDGTRIVTGSADRSARIWDTKTGVEILQLTGHKDAVRGVAVAPDGTRIATGSSDKTARVWDAKTGSEILTLKGHVGPILGIAYTPDGTRIVTGSADRSARIWDAKTGTEVLKLTGHEDAVRGVAVTPDGARIVTGAAGDGQVRLWDAKTGAEIFRFKGHTQRVNGVAVTPDGKRIVTGSSDITARVWELAGLPEHQSEDHLDQAKKIVSRCLTIKERGDLVLRPQPPAWCIETAKYPYDSEGWRNKVSIATEIGTAFRDTEIATAFGDFSDRALYNGDFPVALEAAELGMKYDPNAKWIEINRAHALMFLGRLDEARALYLKHRGTVLVDKGPWEKEVIEDFEKLQRQGLDHGLMAEIKKAFQAPPSAQ